MRLTQKFHSSTSLVRLALLLALGTLAVAVAACGGSSSASSGDSGSAAGGGSASGSADQEEARTRLADCLREQGAEMPGDIESGDGPPNAGDVEKLQEAMNGPCKALRQDAFGDLTEEDVSDRLTQFTSCLREQGVDVPDFDPAQGPPPGINLDDPKVQQAAEACKDKLPSGGFGSPGGSSQ